MDNTDSKGTIRQTAYLLSAIVRRIREKRLDKSRQARLSISAAENCADSKKAVSELG